MAKEKEKNQFSNIMNKIKEESTRRGSNVKRKIDKEAAAVKTLIQPVLTDFIEGDKALMIQSSTDTSYVISYGLLYVCKLEISTADEQISISLVGDPNFSYMFSLPTDQMNTAIGKKLEDGLLKWYKSCFS